MDTEQFKEQEQQQQEEPAAKKVKLDNEVEVEVEAEKKEEVEKNEVKKEEVKTEEKKDEEMKEEESGEEGGAVADEFEMSVGIRRYLNPDVAGFTGILKDRYSDFIVNEVTPQGEVVHLKDITSLPKEDEPVKSEDKPEGEDTAAAAAPTSPEEALAAIIGAEAAKNFFEWAAKAQETKEGEESENSEAKAKFEFPLLEDRDKRMAIHSFVRENFKNINTTTENK